MKYIEYKLDYHADVENDIYESFLWYEMQEEGLGKKLIANIKQKIAQIVAMPEAYSVKSKKQYREAIVEKFPFTITYKIFAKKNTLFISSIHHQSKDPDKKYR